jgi:hypothetical protein
VTPNQLTAHNIKVSSFVTIGKTRLNHHHQHQDEDEDTSLFLKPLRQPKSCHGKYHI